MSLRSYSGPPPPRAPSSAAIGLSWVLAVVTIGLQVAYALVDTLDRQSLLPAVVVTFFLASLVHAAACHRWRGFVMIGLAVPAIGWGAARVSTTSGLGLGDYPDVLGFDVFGVPAVIPLAWAAMAYPAYVAASTVTWRRWLMPILAAWSLAAWNVVLHPVLTDLGAWTWTTSGPDLPGVEGVPLVGLAGWLAVGLVIGVVLLVLRTEDAPVAQPATLYLWGYVSSVVGAAVVFDTPGVAVVGGIALGLVALPFIWRLWLDRT